MTPQEESRIREVLNSIVFAKSDWELPEPRAIYSAETAIAAAHAYALSCVEAEREASVCIADKWKLEARETAAAELRQGGDHDLSRRCEIAAIEMNAFAMEIRKRNAIRTQGNTND